MGKVLNLIWACKVFLTAMSAWKYCSESSVSPTCWVSGLYAAAIFGAVVFSCNRNTVMAAVNSQEGEYLKLLEEGLGETFTTVNQNNGAVYSSIRPDRLEWQNTVKKKHS